MLDPGSDRYIAYGAAFTILLLVHLWVKHRRTDKSQILLKQFLESVKQVKGFVLENEKPIAHRPFNPPKRTNLKMGLTRIDQDQWLMIDRDLKKTLLDKHKVLKAYPGELVLCNDVATEAVHECYDTVVRFLSQKYPQYYALSGNCMINRVLNTEIPFPAASSKLSNLKLLELMAENFEEDILLLEYSEKNGEYTLRAGNCVYPSGFSPTNLLNRPLTEIHDPVPHYREKLQNPMNRFFDRVKAGDYVHRLNWGMQQGNARAIPNIEAGKAMGRKASSDPEKVDHVNIDPLKMNLRVERQTLSRLPISKYIVFTTRTYLYPLPEVKKEGLGSALVESIENLDFYMGKYKGREVWGDSVAEYLLS